MEVFWRNSDKCNNKIPNLLSPQILGIMLLNIYKQTILVLLMCQYHHHLLQHHLLLTLSSIRHLQLT